GNYDFLIGPLGSNNCSNETSCENRRIHFEYEKDKEYAIKSQFDYNLSNLSEYNLHLSTPLIFNYSALTNIIQAYTNCTDINVNDVSLSWNENFDSTDLNANYVFKYKLSSNNNWETLYGITDYSNSEKKFCAFDSQFIIGKNYDIKIELYPFYYNSQDYNHSGVSYVFYKKFSYDPYFQGYYNRTKD
ncbi:MAG: hypothetical protein V1824_02295, partial [archaeon]